jgi:hypothetical protein
MLALAPGYSLPDLALVSPTNSVFPNISADLPAARITSAGAIDPVPLPIHRLRHLQNNTPRICTRCGFTHVGGKREAAGEGWMLDTTALDSPLVWNII